VLTGQTAPESAAAPVYFMTEDDISRGLSTQSLVSGESYETVGGPSRVESVVASLPTGTDGTDELWKLNHYYERLDDWHEAHGLPTNPFAGPAAEPQFELHNLTADPEERRNAVGDAPDTLGRLQSILIETRNARRRVPVHRNPVG
jgi:hypothetical protein